MKKIFVALMVAMSVMFGSEPVKAFAFTSPDQIQAAENTIDMKYMEKEIVRKSVWLWNHYPYQNIKVMRVGHGITNDGYLSFTVAAMIDGEEVVEHWSYDYDETVELFNDMNIRYTLGQLNIWQEW